MTFLTMVGYVEIAGSFTDERAKLVRRGMKERYFKIAQMLSDVQQIEKYRVGAAEAEIWKDKYLSALEDIRDRTKKKRAFRDDDKAFILELQAKGMPQSEIKALTGWSKGTVSNIINYGNASGRIVA